MSFINITTFLKEGKYLDLKVGLPEKNVYSVLSKKQLGKKWHRDDEDILCKCKNI